MSKDSDKWAGWLGDTFVHPDAPLGGGGPARFRSASTLDCRADEWHPGAPASRYCVPMGNRRLQPPILAAAPGDPSSHLPSKGQKQSSIMEQVASFAAAHLGKPSIGTGGGDPEKPGDRPRKHRPECTGLPEAALKNAGAKIADDYERVTGKEDQDYIWGEEKDKFQRGQILQFRDHRSVRITRTDVEISIPDEGKFTFWLQDRDVKIRGPQHTAILASDEGDGVIYVYEQHVTISGKEDQKDNVQENIVYTQNQSKVNKETYDIDFSDQKSKDEFRKKHMLNTRRYATTDQTLIKFLTANKVKKATVIEKMTTKVEVTGRIWAYEPQPKR